MSGGIPIGEPGNERLAMERADLEGIPPLSVPEAFSLRTFKPGDEAPWVAIHEVADQMQRVTRETFDKNFGESPGELEKRQLFLTTREGEPVGTATAWFDQAYRGARWGRIHWVAVLPGWQGRGLGRLLVVSALHRLRDLGETRAYLTTSAGRVPAIRLYESLGFVRTGA